MLISDWCAKYYEGREYKGWEKVVGETSRIDVTKEENDKISSVRVRPGCTLNLFKHYVRDGKNMLLDSLTDDVSFLTHYEDEVSSLSCTCKQGIFCMFCFYLGGM